jgi:hypothetical protein
MREIPKIFFRMAKGINIQQEGNRFRVIIQRMAQKQQLKVGLIYIV